MDKWDERAQNLIKWLSWGGRQRIDDRTYLFSDEHDLCILAYNQDGEERYLKVNLGEFSYKDYRALAGTMTEDEYSAMLANMGFNAARIRKNYPHAP